MPLSLTRSLTVQGTFTNDSSICITTDAVTSGSNSFPTLTRTITDGTGAGQCNKWYRAYRTLAAGAADNLDLAGSLLDPFGNTLTFTGIKYIAIALISASANGTNKLTIGNATNPWIGPMGASGTIDVFDALELYHPGTSGWAVTAATGDILKINNGGAASITYCILIAGNG
jgi:hypothetical protein